jgi:3-hydroxybutyryl-CoA dehydratase
MFKINDKFEVQFVITDAVYNGFVTIFNDTNPLHTDEHFALSKGFKGLVMHGNILNGFLSHFVGECLPEKDVIIHSQEIKFKKPVFLNDSLLFEARVINIYESVGVVEFKFHFKNAGSIIVSSGKIQIGLI